MSERSFITFFLGDELFGIDILYIREINRNLDITQVHRSPEFIRGLLDLRGQIITVMDLAIQLGLEKREETDTSNCIILKTTQELEKQGFLNDPNIEATTQETVGLFIDKIGDVVTVDQSKIEAASTHTHGVSAKFLDGVITLDQQILVTLKLSELLTNDLTTSLESNQQELSATH